MKVDKENIKHIQRLLCAAVDYINHEKHLRNVYQGADPRLDKESDDLVKEIKNEFTLLEWEEAHKAYLAG